MKPNHINSLNRELLISLQPLILEALNNQDIWSSLDIDYYPPVVKRLYTQLGKYRIYLHEIYSTNEKCLFHKHRWPAVFKQLEGEYEMGFTYCENEVSSEEASLLPILGKFVMVPGSYYEMKQTDALHYVKPLTPISYSLMITEDLYDEAKEIRKEREVERGLKGLSILEKQNLIYKFKNLLRKELGVYE